MEKREIVILNKAQNTKRISYSEAQYKTEKKSSVVDVKIYGLRVPFRVVFRHLVMNYTSAHCGLKNPPNRHYFFFPGGESDTTL